MGKSRFRSPSFPNEGVMVRSFLTPFSHQPYKRYTIPPSLGNEGERGIFHNS